MTNVQREPGVIADTEIKQFREFLLSDYIDMESTDCCGECENDDGEVEDCTCELCPKCSACVEHEVCECDYETSEV